MNAAILGSFLLGFPFAGPVGEPAALPSAVPPATFVQQPNAPATSQAAQLKGGKWKAVGLQRGSTKLDRPTVEQMMPGLMEFGDGKIVMTYKGKQVAEVPYSVDESVSPARITVAAALLGGERPGKNATLIFRVSGDKLEMAGGEKPDTPPAGFAPAPGTGDSVIAYERVK